MKRFNKALSVFLCLILSLSFITVLASAKSATIHWDYFNEDYVVSRELKEGTITIKGTGTFIYSFTADKAGIYSIDYMPTDVGNSYGSIFGVSEEVVGNNVSGYKPYEYTEEFGTIFSFEKGETEYVLLQLEDEYYACDLTVKYLGNISNIELESYDFQAGYNIYAYDVDDSFKVELGSFATVTTDTNNIFTLASVTAPFDSMSLTEKEYNLNISLFNYVQNIDITVYRASDYLSEIKINDDFQKPVIYVDKYGDVDDFFYDETSFNVDFILKDGTVIKNDVEDYAFSFTAPDGRKVVLYESIRQADDGSHSWSAYCDEEIYYISDVTVKESTNTDDGPTGGNFFKTLVKYFKTVYKTFKKIITWMVKHFK